VVQLSTIKDHRQNSVHFVYELINWRITIKTVYHYMVYGVIRSLI